MKYHLYQDETYRLNGERKYLTFDTLDEAVNAYMEQRKGMACITVEDEMGKRSILKDKDGRKYVKGSPFYEFPHVPHISKYTGKEIPTT
jgi:predicted P-loop ATPase